MFPKFESATKTIFGEHEQHTLSYFKSQPSYPKEAVRLLRTVLGIISGKTVLDLATGAEKLTECLLDTTENSVDFVLLGTPFQAYDANKTLSEIARVLKPKGGLGLIWNMFDDNIDWVKKTNSILAKTCDNQLHFNMEWKKAFDENPTSFLPLQHRTISFSYLDKVSNIVDNFLFTNCLFSLTKEKHEFLFQEICHLLEISISNINEKEILIPYRTEIYWTFKL